jgi:predicted permease
VGRSITLNGRAYEVVGVMPSRFQFPRDDVRLWTPFEPADDRNIYFLQVVGRLRPHASVREAQAEMDGIAARLRDEYPQSNLNREKTAVVPLRDYFVGERRASYWLLFGASGLVLLVAVANVAGLLITHGIQRRREIAIRTALGAGRLHVTRQLAVEGLTLSVTGGLFGTALAVGTFRYLEMLMPSGLSGAGAPALDLRLLAFSLAVVLVSGIIFSLAPLFRMQDSTGNAGLGARSTGYPSRSRARTALVVFQVALALVVVASTALLLRTVENLEAVDPGFRSENVLTARLEQFRTNDSIENRKRFYREVVERIERLPGVTAAGFTTFLPYTSTSGATFFVLEDRPDLATESSIAYRREVTPGYFAALGLPLLAGRVFDQNDDTDSPPVVVVSQYIADLLGGDAVGKRLGYLTAGNAPPSWMTIVGVVGEIRQESLDRPSERAVVYLPVAQSDRLWFFNPRDVVVRTPGDPLQLAAALRRAVWAVDPDQSVSNVRTLETLVGGQLSERRTIAFLFTTFSALVLVLAALGVYGLMAFVVASRAREFGLRMALGAERRDVARSVARQGALWIGSGVAAGLAGSLAVTQTLESLLYEVQPVDAVSLAAAIVALSTAGTVAALVPVWRATRVDPMTVLRFE